MSDKKPKDIVERISSIDDEIALKLLCRLAGSTKAFADTSGIPYHKINNIIQGKSTIKQDMLLSFYRDTLTDEFRRTLEDTCLLMTALAELGIIKPGPGLTEMDDFEAKVFDLTHDGGEASLGRDNTPKGERTRDEPEETLPATFVAEVTSGGEPKEISMSLKIDPQKFGFRPKKPLDKRASPAYYASIVDDLITNVGKSIPSEPEVSDPSPMTGDILENVKTGGNVHATPIGDSFETGFRLDIPDRFDSDNKRF